MGSTLSVANFSTKYAQIAKDATMYIKDGNVTITNNISGDGKLVISGNSTKIDVKGNLGVNVTAKDSAKLTYGSKDADVAIDGNSGNVTPYSVEKDTKVRAFNVVK